MSDNKSPSLTSRVIIGVIGGAVMTWFLPRPPTPDGALLSMLLGDALFGVLFAFGYYLLFRGLTADVKRDDKLRTAFAGGFFSMIGIIIGVVAVDFIHGDSIVRTLLFPVFNLFFLSVAYVKLLRLYRAGNTDNTGGKDRGK